LRKLNSNEIAMASTCASFSAEIRPSISSSASGVTIAASEPIRSVISNLRRRGMSVAGGS
jgi:hypothetical protein